MPNRDGTGPNGNNGCLTNNLPRGFFRYNRGTGVGRNYGRGRGFRGGRQYNQLSREERVNYLKQEKQRIENELKGLEKELME